MYKVGDYIIYGGSGVCRVGAVGKLKDSKIDSDRLYYTLEPAYLCGNTIYTPVENNKVFIRPILSREETMDIIDHIREIDCLWVTDEKNREQLYKEALHSCDCKELVKIIKTSYLRKQERLSEGKKVTATDEKYLHLAEDRLYGEFAIPLEMNKNEVEAFITEQVEKVAI